MRILPRRPLRLSLLAGALLLAGGALTAGEEPPPPPARVEMVEIVKGMDDVFPELRVQAIRRAGTQTDGALVEEFGLLRRLLEIAQSGSASVRERTEALRSLVKLHENGFRHRDMLDFLSTLVAPRGRRGRGAPLLVRLEALRLIQESGTGDDLQTMKAYRTLAELTRVRGLPSRLGEALYRALGGFYRMDGVRDLLLQGLKEKDPAVRLGATKGLARYLELSGEENRTLRDALVRRLAAAKTEAAKLATIEALEKLAANGATFIGDSTVREVLLSWLEAGTDREVQTAIRFLMRTADEAIAEKLLAKAKAPGAARPETRRMLLMALVGAMRHLGQSRDSDAVRPIVERIVDYFITVMNPAAQQPKPLRQSAIFGLGSVPVEFDRTKAAHYLIRLLQHEKDEALIEVAERSLQMYTGEEPMRRPETPQSEETVPDIEAYAAWLEANRENLAPGKTPWDR